MRGSDEPSKMPVPHPFAGRKKAREMVGHPRAHTHPRSEQLLRVEEDGHRAIVEEFDLHVLLEASGFAGESGGADLADEMFVERASDVRRSRRIERWALSAADVPEESKLRDGEHAAPDIRNAEVHLARVIIENTKPGDFFGEVVGVGFGVRRRHAEEHEKSAADLAGDFVILSITHADLSAANALHHGTHAN